MSTVKSLKIVGATLDDGTPTHAATAVPLSRGDVVPTNLRKGLFERFLKMGAISDDKADAIAAQAAATKAKADAQAAVEAAESALAALSPADKKVVAAAEAASVAIASATE